MILQLATECLAWLCTSQLPAGVANLVADSCLAGELGATGTGDGEISGNMYTFSAVDSVSHCTPQEAQLHLCILTLPCSHHLHLDRSTGSIEHADVGHRPSRDSWYYWFCLLSGTHPNEHSYLPHLSERLQRAEPTSTCSVLLQLLLFCGSSAGSDVSRCRKRRKR